MLVQLAVYVVREAMEAAGSIRGKPRPQCADVMAVSVSPAHLEPSLQHSELRWLFELSHLPCGSARSSSMQGLSSSTRTLSYAKGGRCFDRDPHAVY